MVGLPWSQHVAFLDDRRSRTSRCASRRRRTVRRAGGPSGGADVRARQRDSARRSCAGTAGCASSGSSAALRRGEATPRPIACSPTSTSRRPNSSTSPFLDVCAFNVYLHRETGAARATWRGCSTSPDSKPLLLAEAGADSIREGARRPGRAHRDAPARGVRGRAPAARSPSRGPTSGGAAGTTVDDWAFGLVDRERAARSRRRPRWPQVFADAPFSEDAQRGRGRASRSWSAPTTPPTRSTTASTALERARLPRLRDHRRQRRLAGRDRRHRQRHPQRPRRRHAERRPERGAQRRPGGRDRRNRRLHRRRHARRSRLAHVPRPAVPELGRRRRRRTERRAGRRPVDGAVRRPGAGRSDARAARRSHRRARPRLQHGVPARGARSRSAASTRSTCAPATTWTCAGGCRRAAARSASPPRRSSGITTARRSRRYWRQQVGYGEGERWLMAHHPEKFARRRACCGTATSTVRCRSCDRCSGARVNAGVWGTAAFPSVYRTDVHPFAFLPHSVKWQVLSTGARRSPASSSPGSASMPWAAATAARRRRRRHCRDDCEEHRLRAAIRRRVAARAAASGTRVAVAYLHLPSAVRAHRRPIRGVLLAAGGRAAGRRSAQTSRGPRPSLGEAGRALLPAGGRRRPRIGSGARRWTSERAGPAAAHRLAAALARRRAHRHRRRLVARSRRQRAGGPMGLARRARARRGARRRQDACCASARTCGRPAWACSARSRSSPASARGGDHRRRAALAARGRRRARSRLRPSPRSACGGPPRRPRSCAAASEQVASGSG